MSETLVGTQVRSRTIVLMGVCGSGKTTLGQRLSQQLGWDFFDGDDFHPSANVDKMASGRPLDDDDRRPWLEALRDLLDRRLAAGEGTILACSALKESYRSLLGTERPEILLVFLDGSRELLSARMASRQGHFMPSGLLDSQLATLEDPLGDGGKPALRLDVSQTPAELCLQIVQAIFD